jgi:hypothetical protein
MHDWLGMGLIPLGVGLLISGVIKRRTRMATVVPAGAIRPEFAAMGDIMRPIILFIVAYFAFKMSLFYFVLGGDKYLSPLDFSGILFVLASYSTWLVLATKRRRTARDEAPAPDVLPAPAPAE